MPLKTGETKHCCMHCWPLFDRNNLAFPSPTKVTSTKHSCWQGLAGSQPRAICCCLLYTKLDRHEAIHPRLPLHKLALNLNLCCHFLPSFSMAIIYLYLTITHMHCGELQHFFKYSLKHDLSNDLVIFNTIQNLLSFFSVLHWKLPFFLLSPTVEYHLLAVCGTRYTTNSSSQSPACNQISPAPQGLHIVTT